MSDTKTLRAALEVESKALSDLVKSVSDTGLTIEGDRVTIDEKGYEAISERRGNVSKLKELLAAEGEFKSVQDLLNAPAEAKSRFAAGSEYKSVADVLLDSEEFKEYVARGAKGAAEADIPFRDIIQHKDVYSAMASYTPTYNIASNVQQLPMVPAPAQRQRVRDLFPQASTASNLLEYWISKGLNNEGKGNAATVGERSGGAFALKPQSDLSFEHASDPVRLIAHWIPAHRNTLADAPQLRSIIDNQLLYGLALAEDDQLLNGDGAGENLLGLLKRPGIQSYVPTNGEWKSDSLRRALTLGELSGFPSNGFVLHPSDWEDVELQRGTSNDHYAITTNVAVGAQQRVWRTPVVTTPVIGEGIFLAAAFGQACQVYDREQANIRVAEQHADFFIRNAVVILAEERLGLTVQNPGAVVQGTYGV